MNSIRWRCWRRTSIRTIRRRSARDFSGITLAYNVEKKADVDQVIALAREAGATILKESQPVFWGGYHAYFSDPDGYVWEVAWGPNFQYDEQGLLKF